MCVVGWPGERPDRRLSWSNPSQLSRLRWRRCRHVSHAHSLGCPGSRERRASERRGAPQSRRSPRPSRLARPPRGAQPRAQSPSILPFGCVATGGLPVRTYNVLTTARYDTVRTSVQTFRCPNACRNVGANALQGLGNLASDSPNPCLNSSLDNLSPSLRGRGSRPKMSELEGRQGWSRSEHQDCRTGAGCRARARNRRSFFGNFPPAPFSMNG